MCRGAKSWRVRAGNRPARLRAHPPAGPRGHRKYRVQHRRGPRRDLLLGHHGPRHARVVEYALIACDRPHRHYVARAALGLLQPARIARHHRDAAQHGFHRDQSESFVPQRRHQQNAHAAQQFLDARQNPQADHAPYAASIQRQDALRSAGGNAFFEVHVAGLSCLLFPPPLRAGPPGARKCLKIRRKFHRESCHRAVRSECAFQTQWKRVLSRRPRAWLPTNGCTIRAHR